ncbi:IclR family transcriptional regulator [Microbacterium immunditiarum]
MAASGRFLDILGLLEMERSMSLEALSVRWGVTQRSAKRTMDPLEDAGYVVLTEDGEYAGGPRLVRLGSLIQRRTPVIGAAHATLQRMAAESQATVHLAVLDGASVRFVAGVTAEDAVVAARVRTGEIAPAYMYSIGRCLLAALDDAEVRELYPTGDLPKPHGALADRRALLAALDEIRAAGFAVNQDDAVLGADAFEGAGSTSCAVRNPSGRPYAALSIAGPRSRLTPEIRREHREVLERGAHELEFIYDFLPAHAGTPYS